MKITSKVENLKKKKTNKQTNKKQEMIDKLKIWIKKQTHAERERKIQDLKQKLERPGKWIKNKSKRKKGKKKKWNNLNKLKK